jgi:FAD synthase
MKLLHHLPTSAVSPYSHLITLGVFDGLHKGHHALFQKLEELKKLTNNPIAAIIFNRSSYLLHPEEQLKLLQSWGVDIVIRLDLCEEIKQKSYLTFIEDLKKTFNFSHLVLGEDACFGKNKIGTKKNILALQKTFSFKAHYIKKVFHENEVISSSRIRKEMEKGNLSLVKELMGRPFGLSFSLQDLQKYLFSLFLPPSGKYSAQIQCNNRQISQYVQIINKENQKMLYFLNDEIQNLEEPITIKF